MNRDPEAWKRLGRLFRNARELEGLTRAEFALKAGVSEKAVYNAEKSDVPGRHQPPTLVKIAVGHGWRPESIQQILDGGDPIAVDDEKSTPQVNLPATGAQAQVLELVPRVYEFGRLCTSLGAEASARDEFDAAVQHLLESASASASKKGRFTLAAYRPHALGEGVPADDADAILRAMEDDGH
ncbi:helix-turn-helix transcriptional regulator [Streptomyces virginiae]|uniref:helix-turn-helix transcriptional regulator n=1 Tax=Streptomyces virginiae TaxID=1961 RepID=UPI002250000D|nr:helix-turn-helix transcriptional regulator [Streptomyces virginiae]MCX5176780.1 helix-turn-helix domain-containing protein [Streptomyces virginiae]